jgi:hypothetical protein
MVRDIIWKADCHSACQKISCFLYGTRRFITVFTQACHWTLFWASWIQFAPSIPISLRSIVMLSSHLRLYTHCLSPKAQNLNDANLICNWATCCVMFLVLEGTHATTGLFLSSGLEINSGGSNYETNSLAILFHLILIIYDVFNYAWELNCLTTQFWIGLLTFLSVVRFQFYFVHFIVVLSVGLPHMALQQLQMCSIQYLFAVEPYSNFGFICHRRFLNLFRQLG